MTATRVLRSELHKLRTLPTMLLTAAATVLAAAAIAAAITAGLIEEAAGTGPSPAAGSPDHPVHDAMVYLQAGIILLGVLAVAHEYAGRQLRTSLLAMPRRPLLLGAKTAAATTVTALVAALSVAAAWGGAAVVAAGAGEAGEAVLKVLTGEGTAARLGGAILYLVLIGLLAQAVTVLVRGLVPGLVIMLSAVMIASPLLAAAGEHARWLPDRAGRLLYAGGDAVLSAWGGAGVLLGWIVLVGAAAALAFTRREP